MVHVYGGPGFQYVTNDFNVGWDEFLVTNRLYHVIFRYLYNIFRSIAVVFIDGRGSRFAGSSQRFAVSRKLGKYEIIDQ